MKNKLHAVAIFAVTIATIGGLAWAQGDTVKLTIKADDKSPETFFIETGKPLVVDDRHDHQFQAFVGCDGANVVTPTNKTIVGRRVVVSTTSAGTEQVFVNMDYLSSKLANISPFKATANCTINNATTTSVSTGMNLFLHRGDPVTVALPSDGQKDGGSITFEML